MNVRRGVLWDSSAILALLDANDAYHERAVRVASQIASERRPSFITITLKSKLTRCFYGS
jgi:predicted nucleic acid-binding protein